MELFYLLVFSLILIGAFCGFLRYKSLNPPFIKLFPYFLLFQFAYQFAGYYYSFVYTAHQSNFPIFNIANFINFTFFASFFYTILSDRRVKLFILSTSILWVFFFFANVLLESITSFMVYSRTAIGILIVVYSLLYFYEILTDENVNKNPFRDATFWFSTALFFFYLCSTLTTSLWNYLVINDYSYGRLLINLFAFLLYGMYIVGFLLHKNDKPEQKHISLPDDD